MQQIQLDEVGAIPGQPGWHVNATHAVQAWDAWQITPAEPRQVFAGADTVFYAFPDHGTYQGALQALQPGDMDAPAPRHVPASVTARQAHQALIIMGKYDLVAPAINAVADPVQRRLLQAEWDKSQTFDRHRPTLIALAKGALGMSDEDIDALFVFASTL